MVSSVAPEEICWERVNLYGSKMVGGLHGAMASAMFDCLMFIILLSNKFEIHHKYRWCGIMQERAIWR